MTNAWYAQTRGTNEPLGVIATTLSVLLKARVSLGSPLRGKLGMENHIKNAQSILWAF